MKHTALLTMAALLAATPALANHDGNGSQMADHMILKMDTNGDGKVSKEEHDAFGEKMFSETDTNKDGYLSRDEMVAMSKKKHEQWKNRSGSHRSMKSDDGKESM